MAGGEGQSVAPSTLQFHRATATKLCAYFGPRADEAIGGITRANLIAFRASLAEQVSPTTANPTWPGSERFSEPPWLLAAWLRTPLSSLNRCGTQPDAASRRPFTVPELQAVLAVAGPEWQSLIKIGFYTGARLCDVAVLKWSHADLDKWELCFIARKTGWSVLVPVAGPLRSHLMALASSDDLSGYLHPEAARSVARQGNSSKLSAQFGSLLAQAGLRPPST